MKKTLSLILCLVLMLACTAMAEGITFPYDGEPVTFNAFVYDGIDQSPELPGIKAWNEHIGNITIEKESISYSDFCEKAQIMLATGDIPDILPIWDIMSFINQYGDTGIFLDFNAYLDYMPNLKKYLETYPNLNYICDDEGHRYGIVGVQPLDFSGESWFVNMDVLNAAGVEKVPDTFDEFVAAMRQIKAYDPTIIPFQSYWNIDYTLNWIGRSLLGNDHHASSMVYYDTEEGTYKFTYGGESAEQRGLLIDTLHTFYEEGLIHPEIATLSFEQELANLAEGKWAFCATYMATPEGEVFKVEKGAAMPFDIQPMLPPATSTGERYLGIAYQHDGLPWWGIVCSADVEHPELLAAYMDQVVSPYGRDLFNYGVEGVTFDYVDGVPVPREGVDATGYAGTQYEVWMVGMGAPVQQKSGNIIRDKAFDMVTEAFISGELTASFDPVFTTFTSEAAAEKSSMENDLITYRDENEAAFIYGQRDIAEWDMFIEEMASLTDVDALIEMYNSADTIVRSPERVFVAE